jgi:hypothetical protein
MSNHDSENEIEDYSSSGSEENDQNAQKKQDELLNNISSILKPTEEISTKRGPKLVRKEVKLIGMFWH